MENYNSGTTQRAAKSYSSPIYRLFGLVRSMFRRNRKNIKFTYYLRNVFRLLLPKYFYQKILKKKLLSIKKFNQEYVMQRVNLYNKLAPNACNPSLLKSLKEFKLPSRLKVYFFDSFEYTRYFSSNLHLNLLPGDITTIPNLPTIVKSRPISGDNANSVILKLDKVRHFFLLTIQNGSKKRRIFFLDERLWGNRTE